MARSGSMRGLIRSGGVIALAMAAMNVSTYAFTILAARLLGPAQYGAVASLMGLLLVVNVLALGLQATGARQVAADPGRRDQIEARIMAATYRAALTLGALCLVLAPLISWALSLDGWHAASMIGLSAIPLTLMGGQAGVLQGEQRWMPLAGIYLAAGLGRLVIGLVLMLLVPSAFGAMLAVAVAAWLPAVVGALALGHVGPRRRSTPRPRHQGGRILREVVTNSHALLAFFALSNLDVVLARAVFAEHEAGLYAGGLILTKAVLFLPQFVVVIAFPSMASTSAQHRMYLKGLVVVGTIGVVATAGAAALSDLALVFIGGAEYSQARPHLWLFALLGTLLALIQLMVYEIVARQRQSAIVVLWVGLLAVGTLGLVVDRGAGLAAGVAVIYTTVLVVLLGAALLHPGSRARRVRDLPVG
ncbi:lipopolysaccharide biosynthesis protein [Nocardioides sp.]|uniref:lipopolysaccharide biosynthesis protein n=1 Tax=Nocardioides sp. TaxID=35761 RepID=UPI0027348556|nr:polysaccharide biosynthesis protein [Nocardioides sp.]MDP3894609.1 polysaccharide biosynthesis protein [Nocardioides sp.]